LASTSPSSVIKAYYEQYRKDFSIFLKCRALESVEGGSLILTFIGRKSEDPSSKECCYVWEVLAMGLNEMVLEVNYDIFCSENRSDHQKCYDLPIFVSVYL